MVVTLGAFELHAQEEPRRAAGEILRLELVGLIEDAGRSFCPTAWNTARRLGEQIAHELVVTNIGFEPLSQPGRQRGLLDLCLLVRLRQQPGPPDVGEVADVRISIRRIVRVGFQDALDPEAALVGPIIVQKVANFRDRRDAPGQVEVDAPKELGIVGPRRRLDVLAPGSGDVGVDRRRQRLDVFIRRLHGGREGWEDHAQTQNQPSRACHRTNSCSEVRGLPSESQTIA